MNKEKLRELIRDILANELKAMLHDVTYRIKVLYDNNNKLDGLPHRVTSHMLNLSTHQLDGFLFDDNKPISGSVTWTDCNIVYKGQTYKVDDGSTDKRFIWWEYEETTFSTGNTKPTLYDDDVLVAINENGEHQLVIGTGRMIPGGAILSGTINSDEIKDNAIIAAKILNGAITEGKIDSGAVTEGKIGSGAVTSGKLGAGAVAEEKLSIALHLLF